MRSLEIEMADVTGPTSTLPGATRGPVEKRCDECDKPATVCVQGETDSFGAEWYDFCDEHYQKHTEDVRAEDRSGECEWCGKFAERLGNARDYDEGLSGPVYRVCKACRDRQNDALQEELEYWRGRGIYV